MSVTSSRDSAVLVDEAAEAIAAFDVCLGTAGEWDRVDRAIGRSLAEALVRTHSWLNWSRRLLVRWEKKGETTSPSSTWPARS